MLRWILILSFAILTGLMGTAVACEQTIIDFSDTPDGQFPEGWGTRPKSGQSEFKVVHSSEAYLQAKSNGTAVRIGRKIAFDATECPYLGWEWRVVTLPHGADERWKKTGDSGAAVYVVLEGMGWPKTIKYVWSSRLKIGARLRSPFDTNTHMVVLRNHKSPRNTWITEKVNVLEDLKKFFPDESGKVRGLAMMTDSDNTKSKAEAHYRKFIISSQ